MTLRKKILETLDQEKKLSMNEIAEHLGYARLTNTLREVLNEMIREGTIFYLYPEKPNSRNQKVCRH